MQWKSVLKPEGSVMAGMGVAGSVFAVYQLDIGSVSMVQASPANHASLAASRKKAGYTAFLLVTALSLITRDGNVAVLGYASIIGMEIHYRHAIMADPVTGQIVPPALNQYAPAQNVIPLNLQGQTG